MLGGISVQCRVAAITVTISKNFLVETKIQESALYLGFRECGVDGGNATHVQLTVAWNECSTRLVHVSVSYTLYTFVVTFDELTHCPLFVIFVCDMYFRMKLTTQHL